MKGFRVNLSGRVKNFHLPKSQTLVPLFEAIVNSIHAINERHELGEDFCGKITINLIRDNQQILDCVSALPPIVSFEIIDNGIGFDENNLNSFMESDSDYKLSLGGKGVGRFSWLIAFEKAEIESVYHCAEQYFKREFIFSLNEPEINDAAVPCDNQFDNETKITLFNCKKTYRESIPKTAKTIAMRIIEHCLVYFISDDCPQIDLVDSYESLRVNLNQIFEERIKTDKNHVEIRIQDQIFELLHVKATEASIGGNKLYLCAHNRLVETKELEKYITDLDRSIYDENDFWYVGVLKGKYLDDSVDMNRISFNIPDGGIGDSLISIITMDQIMKHVVLEVESFLETYLIPIRESKMKKINDFVKTVAPQYRHLLKYMSEDIQKIKPNLSDDRLDDELYQIKRKFDKKNKEDTNKLLEKIEEGFKDEYEYSQLFEEQISKISEANQAELANYVAHRKIIISLLESGIRKVDDDSFNKESYIHKLIYPMRTTSNDIDYKNHNLWLIDEKLSYCSFISSDIPFGNDNKEKRTDIMILDNPVAVSDDELNGQIFDTIILFELKRPMRDNYTTADNPITQLYEYVEKIVSEKARDKYGRIIKVGNGTKFYLYAVCDITPSLEKVIRFNGLKPTPDRMGYYYFNDTYNAYVEILSYDKIINDAKKRNRILFDKLGM